MGVTACPKCRARVRVPDDAVGKRAACPACRQVFQIEASATPIEAPAAPVEATPSPPPPHPGPPQLQEKAWHVLLGGRQCGPFSTLELRGLAASSEIRRESLVWREGMQDWAPAGDTPVLGDCFARPPSVPSPPRPRSSIYERSRRQPPGPSGIGGWLVLPAIGLVIAPVRIVVGIVQAVSSFDTWQFRTVESRFPQLATAVRLEVWLDALGLVFIAVAAIAFFGKKPAAPKLMVALLLYNVLKSLVLTLIVGPAMKDLPTEATAPLLTALVGTLVGALVWIPYFLTSRRVKATFVSRSHRGYECSRVAP